MLIFCCRCAQLQQILLEDAYIKQQWQNAVHWLQNEMERVSLNDPSTIIIITNSLLQRPYVGTGYSYAGWSPPAQSNEASNGYAILLFIMIDNVWYTMITDYKFYNNYRYFLERSNSAKLTLKRARELFPAEVCAVCCSIQYKPAKLMLRVEFTCYSIVFHI